MSDTETNGNNIHVKGTFTANESLEDLSEYSDADDSTSAPTEVLAEFLSAIMLKDYQTALNYCKLILHYEPNNSTAKEFYPLITEKIELMKLDQNESDEDGSFDSDFTQSTSSSHSLTSGEESESKTTFSDATSGSFSSLEDEEVNTENNGKDERTIFLSRNDIVNGNADISNKMQRDCGPVRNCDERKTDKRNDDLKQKFYNLIGPKTISAGEIQESSTKKKSYSKNFSNMRFRDEEINDQENHNIPNFSNEMKNIQGSFDVFSHINSVNRPMFFTDSGFASDQQIKDQSVGVN